MVLRQSHADTNDGRRRADDPALQEARIPPNVLLGVFDLADHRGVACESWLDGIGLTREQLTLPETRVSFRQATAILQRALRGLEPGPIGIQVGSRDVFVSWGLTGFALRAAASVGQAVSLGLDLHQAAGSLLDYEFESGATEFALRLAERSPNPELLAFLCEESCTSILVLARSIFGNQMTPTRLEFAYPRPVYAEAYNRVFRCPIRFNAGATRVYFDAALLNRPLPTANPAQIGLAVDAARHLADPERSRHDIVTTVEAVLRQNLRRPITAAFIAEHLRISERTLHRRLAEAGEKFGEIRDRVRTYRARILLRESDMPLTAIAIEVGFSDRREFRRAYQRWTGRSPSAERAAATAAMENSPHRGGGISPISF
ncbi:AraC family transcriptional regulator [Nocardia anaemiae]|uniref:AraC family transcriptional regulator n=1 Tax=Nocardia anaemiae TaxID=263910 RepID=UPI0007A535E6|nr:AraC family transcriptional regulator [Nocardia anaemiae]